MESAGQSRASNEHPFITFLPRQPFHPALSLQLVGGKSCGNKSMMSDPTWSVPVGTQGQRWRCDGPAVPPLCLPSPPCCCPKASGKAGVALGMFSASQLCGWRRAWGRVFLGQCRTLARSEGSESQRMPRALAQQASQGEKLLCSYLLALSLLSPACLPSQELGGGR